MNTNTNPFWPLDGRSEVSYLRNIDELVNTVNRARDAGRHVIVDNARFVLLEEIDRLGRVLEL